MRELKFRAWNGKAFEHYPVGVAIFNVQRFDISEYAGLKDEKGTEIYENDILLTEYEDEMLNMVVMFIQGSYDLVHIQSGRRHALSHVCYHSSKVVGNTYQNSELLGIKTTE